MGKIIGFDGKPMIFNDEKSEEIKITIKTGGHIKLVSSIENNVLRNEKMLPIVPPEQQENMMTYQKRYSIAQGVDMVLQRAETDETLKDNPIVIVVYPQQVTHDNVYNQDKLTTTLEVGTLVKAELLTDTEIKVQ